MDTTRQYAEAAKGIIDQIARTQTDAIHRAATLWLDTFAAGKRVWVIGPGVHSYIVVEELCYRSAGLFNIYPMECQMLSMGGVRPWTATMMERTCGLALAVFKASGVETGDCVVISNQYGINPVAIESAKIGRLMGVGTIALTSSRFSRSVPADHPARHPSGDDLCDLVDIHVETFIPPDDAGCVIEGFDQKVGALSTFGGVFAANAIVADAVAESVQRGQKIRFTVCGNTPGGDAFNLGNMVELGDEIGFGGSKGRDQIYPTPEELAASSRK